MAFGERRRNRDHRVLTDPSRAERPIELGGLHGDALDLLGKVLRL